MILIRRPASVPAKLLKQRKAGLKRAFAALNAHGAGSKELKDTLTGYQGGRKELFLAQYRKCAFCERRVGLAGNAVEHFRPKKEAWRHLPGDQAVVATGYWWLTWSWVNHLFSCNSCNTGYKQNYFPLVSGSTALAGPSAPYLDDDLRPAHENTSAESALLVDPAIDDPLDHIRWRPVNPSDPKRLWKWQPSHLTLRGRATIKVLQLDQLADDVGDHVRDNVLNRTEAIIADVDGGRLIPAQVAWAGVAADLVRSDSHLAGPTWDALHFLVDETRRRLAGLAIPMRP